MSPGRAQAKHRQTLAKIRADAFTPGPWFVRGDGYDTATYVMANDIHIRGGEDDRIVAVCHSYGPNDRIARLRNAELIASAPKMLSALIRISTAYENQDIDHVAFRVMAKSLADGALTTDGQVDALLDAILDDKSPVTEADAADIELFNRSIPAKHKWVGKVSPGYGELEVCERCGAVKRAANAAEQCPKAKQGAITKN